MTYTYEDTAPEAMNVQLDVLRRMSPQQRLDQAMALTAEIRQMAMNAIRRVYPDLDEAEVNLRFIAQVYGPEIAEGIASLPPENPA